MRKIITFSDYIKENEDINSGGIPYATLNQNGMGKIQAPIVNNTPGSINQDNSKDKGNGNSLFTFYQFLGESDGGGGVGFATPNGNGMGNITAPTVGATPGSVWQSGSGQMGSGDVLKNSSYDDKKFGLKIDKEKKEKKHKRKKVIGNNRVPRYFTKEYMSL